MRAVSTVVAQCPLPLEGPPSGRAHLCPTPPAAQPVLVAEYHPSHEASDLAHSCDPIPPKAGAWLASATERRVARRGSPRWKAGALTQSCPRARERFKKPAHRAPWGLTS